MMKRLVFLALLISGSAFGFTTLPATIGTTAVPCLSNYTGQPGQLPTSWQMLYVMNQSASGGNTLTIAASDTSLAAAETAAVTNGAGAITLSPTLGMTIALPNVGSTYLACKASGSSTPATFIGS